MTMNTKTPRLPSSLLLILVTVLCRTSPYQVGVLFGDTSQRLHQAAEHPGFWRRHHPCGPRVRQGGRGQAGHEVQVINVTDAAGRLLYCLELPLTAADYRRVYLEETPVDVCCCWGNADRAAGWESNDCSHSLLIATFILMTLGPPLQFKNKCMWWLLLLPGNSWLTTVEQVTVKSDK